MLKVTDLTVRRGSRTVVSGVNLTAERGKVLAVLGANGAGKSELVLALAGMLPVQSGKVEVDGRSIGGLPPDQIRMAGIAAVPEGHRVLTRLSVEDNLRAAASVLPAGEVDGALAGVLALFPELSERRKQLAGTMSGGQQQMVAIGHALMARPSFLLIDEMSLGLAPLVVKRLAATVRRLKEEGVGIIIVEQFAEVALSLADTAMVMRLGKVGFSGDADILRTDPKALHAAYFEGGQDAGG